MNKKEFSKLITQSINLLQKQGQLPHFDIPPVFVDFPEKGEHGDYTTNIALRIAKDIKKNPSEIANTLVRCLNKKLKNPKIKKIEAMNGFINFWLSKKELLDSLQKILKEKEKYGSSEIGKGKTIIIDYSSPNIAKPFGVGHLRSTIIGQALYNIYKFLGWKCIGDNHLGDWGTQFGKLIVAIKKWNTKKLNNLTVQELEDLYVRFHKEVEKNPELLEEARQEFKKLEQGDKETKKVWQFCVDISLKEFDKIYKMLGIKIDYALGESFYQDKVKYILKDVEERGVAQKSQGTLIIPLPDIKTPLMLLKADGATVYATRDLATIKYRIEKWKPDLIVWEVGADQKLYFQQLFQAAEMLGYGKKEQFIHIAHGLIRWSYGKFSTRRGDTIHLDRILKEIIEKAESIVSKSEAVKILSEKERQGIAKQVGLGAVKYNDLSRHYSKDIVFDWQRALSLEGNSGPYLQYTAVRCQSVLDRAKVKIKTKIEIMALSQEEENILREIRRFPEIVQSAANNFSPNLICNFAFNLAQLYNIFYEKNPILTAETKQIKEFRLVLTAAVRQVLENCLTLLGVSVPAKM